jgi:hypothetical protein
MLDDLCATLSNMGKYVSKLYNDSLDIRYDLRQQSQRSFGEEFHYNIVETIKSLAHLVYSIKQHL